MQKYKIAFIIEKYFVFGGLQRDMRKFAIACSRAGHDVTVFTSEWNAPAESIFHVELVNFKAASNHKTIKNIESFVQQLRTRNEFDCIFGFNRMDGLDVYFGGDTCLMAKLRRNKQLWRRFLPRYRTYLNMERAVFDPAGNTDILLISRIEMENYQQEYKTPSERLHLLPPGIDIDRLNVSWDEHTGRSDFRSSLGIGQEDLVVLTVGSSFGTKGVDRVINAVASLPQPLRDKCRYVVVGVGEIQKYMGIAKKAGIQGQVIFTGGREDVAKFYHACDVLVHPARTENTGTTLLEAMVAGLPVIVTENCGYASYISHANGGIICSDPFDQTQLNEALCTVLKNDSFRADLASNGKSFCKTADIASMIDKGVKVIIDRARINRENK